MPASASIIPLGENKVREGRPLQLVALSQSISALHICISANRVVSMQLGKDWVLCPELSRRVKRTRSMYKHLGNPPTQYNHLLYSLWDSHLSLWEEKKSRILTAFTCPNKNLCLGASPWHLRSLAETAVWTGWNGEPAGGFSLQLFYCRQNRIQVHAALVLSRYSSMQNSSFQRFRIVELYKTCTQVCKDRVNIWDMGLSYFRLQLYDNTNTINFCHYGIP